MRQSSTWKRPERKVASAERAAGRTEWLTAEIRQRAALPRWLTAAVDRAQRRSTDAQLAVAVLHAKGERFDDSLVVMRLRDFVAWHGALPAGCFAEREVQETGDSPH